MAEPTFCAFCGSEVPAQSAFCPKCGKPMRASAEVSVTTDEAGPSVMERLATHLADRYKVERELGRGGMATVYLAHDLRHERQVAIKVLHPELAASVGADRFEREIKVSAKLQHPHILTLYDSGAAGSLLFYVMPFVEGESLRDKLDREGMLPVDEAINITLEVADALGYAHGLGIVHRDIKPENILLSGGHALVADFGIARAVSAADDHKLTQTGTAVGTPLYMSPEQAMGDEVGPSSDLYSLACMTYEMLTGQPPFTGANARAIMARHTMEMVPGIRLVRDAVPEEVEDAILWALGKVPADRPQTAAAWADALGTPLAATAARRITTRSRPAVTRRVSAAVRVPFYRRPLVLGGGGAVVLLLAAVTWVLFARGAGRAAATDTGLDAARVAVLYFEDVSPQQAATYLADGLTEGLIDALGQVQGLQVVSRGGSAQYRSSAVPGDSIARALGAGTLVRGTVEPEGANVRVTVRLVDGGSNTDIQRASFALPAAQAVAIRDSTVARVVDFIRSRLGDEIRVRQQRLETGSTDAWVLVQRAERSRKQADSAAAAGDAATMAAAFTAADSLAAAAERADARWAVPVTLRGLVAYRRSRLAIDDPAAAGRWIDSGLAHAQRALALAENDPDALELRGSLRYWRWLMQLEPDAARAAALLREAQQDLETATRIRPAQAGAWATLSHLYYQTGSGVDVNVAARRALEEDAFLSNADVVLSRLFYSSYDLGQFVDAAHWCQEGHRRFPANSRFVECQLYMQTTRAETPDPARARVLADSLVAMAPAPDKSYQRYLGNLLVASVLGRAGQTDSARVLASRSTGDAVLDPTRDLTHIAAFVFTQIGDNARAIENLKTYLAANPRRRQTLAEDPGWWFRSLENDPEFRRVVGPAGSR